MTKPFTFVIYATPYNPNDGGAIVLHKLCDTLNRLDHDAKIWPWLITQSDKNEPAPESKQSFSLLKWPRRWLNRKRRLAEQSQPEPPQSDFTLNPNFLTPLAVQSDIEHSIVVYPEIVSGNPLNAKHVVRWLLYKPGFHSGEVEYGDDDLFFCFNEVFDDPAYNKTPGNRLHVTHVFTDIYKQTNFGARSGGCYMVRKGKDRDLSYHPADYRQVDGLSHEELCEVFNQSEVFICYDFHTLYLEYAVLCGCKAVVVPDPNLSKTDIYPKASSRHAIAYGLEEIDEIPIESRAKQLRSYLNGEEQVTLNSVANFAAVAADFFDAGNETAGEP